MTTEDGRRLRILHIIVMLGETNSQYSEHCLPMMGLRDLSICTYFEPQLTPPPEIKLFAGDGSLRGFFRALRSALDSNEYDAIHAHAPQSGLLLVLALLAWRRFDELRTATVYTVHDSFYDYKLRNQALMVAALPAFRRVMFCSNAAYDSLPRVWKWLDRGRWRVVQNGADLERVDRVIQAESITRTGQPFTVISVGRLERVKDPLALLNAFAAAGGPDRRLVLVGAGVLDGTVAGRTSELQLGRSVEMTGLIPRDEVFRRCATADLFVSTSHGEGLPVAVMEAMASGCPVVLSDIPPHREVADGADYIPLVTPGDVDGFAREIRRFEQMPIDERLAIGQQCRSHVWDRFSLAAMHAGTESVYREVARSTKPVDAG